MAGIGNCGKGISKLCVSIEDILGLSLVKVERIRGFSCWCSRLYDLEGGELMIGGNSLDIIFMVYLFHINKISLKYVKTQVARYFNDLVKTTPTPSNL